MNKTELLSTYTAEQLAEMVIEKYNKLRSEEKPFGYHYDLGDGKAIRLIGFEGKEAETFLKSFGKTKKERACQIAECQNRTENDKTELERAKNTINQIDYILEKLFGVRHDTVDKPDEFEKILSEKAKGNVADFLPTKPIKVADILINAMHEPCASVLSFGKPYSMYDMSELRQIAEHLLVYCNYNGEA